MSYGVMKRHGGSLDARCVVKASALKRLCGLLDPRAGSACRDKTPGQPLVGLNRCTGAIPQRFKALRPPPCDPARMPCHYTLTQHQHQAERPLGTPGVRVGSASTSMHHSKESAWCLGTLHRDLKTALKMRFLQDHKRPRSSRKSTVAWMRSKRPQAGRIPGWEQRCEVLRHGSLWVRH